MALSVDYRNVENWETVCLVLGDDGNSYTSPITTALTFATMSVGIREITDQTIIEFFTRLELVQDVYGGFLVMNGGEARITWEDVLRHKGLRTNASTFSRQKFLANLWTGASEKARARMK